MKAFLKSILDESCLDENSLDDFVCVCLAMRFATKRRKTSLTAIGRRTPFNFFKAVEEGRQKTGATDTGS